jgi:probable HAF family extracellular repeat protein
MPCNWEQHQGSVAVGQALNFPYNVPARRLIEREESTGEDMKSKRSACILIAMLAALTVSLRVPAQDVHVQPHQYHHYQINDVGTFGGPQSFQALGFLGVGVLNNAGAFGGWADTSVIDPLCFFDFPDCYAAHAFVWQNGAKTDLGLLPGGTNSQVNWISANGLMSGAADNGQFDPLIGIPQIRGTFWGHDGSITDVGSLPGAYFANPGAVNNRGEVVGTATNTIPDTNSMLGFGYQSRAFYWKDGVMQDLGTLGTGTDAIAGLINEQGQVAGWSYINSVPSPDCSGIGGPVLTTDSFIWDKKNGMRDIGGLGGTCTLARALTNRGQIIGGSSLTGDTTIHPFVWNAATGVTDLLDPSDSSYGFAEGENAHGDVAGGTCDSVTCYAVLWRKSGGRWQKTNLSTITQAAFSIAINSSQQVVGNWSGGAFLSEDGGPMVDLSTLTSSTSGLQLNEAGQINDRGEISLNASDASGNNHAVVLIPCDENHPGVEGCDYSMVDAATAAQNPVPRFVPSGVQRSPRSRRSGRYHVPRV